MTAGATWVDGRAFFKRYPSAEAVEAAWRRSAAARRAGVPTPAVRGGDEPLVLRFDRVKRQGTPTLDAMVRALELLRGMPTAGLARLDPFLRIGPRLDAAPPRIRQSAETLQTRDAALQWPANAAVHGDFHPGQAMRDRAGRVWLIDLDDVALAPPEADLGNLAAWMATQAPGELRRLAPRALQRVLSAARHADPELTGHFMSIALVRRALKLHEKGIAWAAGQLPLLA